jgi:uncharacterized protein
MKSVQAFHVMAKPRGAVCNLNCQYCFYLPKEKLYPGGSFRMNDSILQTYTQQMIASQQVPEVNFSWQGGEPTLMGLDFFRKAVQFQDLYRKPGMQVHNAFQTNATLLDDEWCQFFHENQFLLGVSLDGPPELHDAFRVDKGGRPTCEQVLAGIQLLRKHQVDFNILACVNSLTATKPVEIYRFLRDEAGAQFIQFIPIVEQGSAENELVSSRSVSGQAYGQFLNRVFDEWIRRDVGKVFVQLFDVSLAAWMGLEPPLCVFQETCGQALALEHNGDLFSCDHFVDPPHRLGNLHQKSLAEMVNCSQQATFGEAKKKLLPRCCQDCPVSFICHGGCPKDRILVSPDGEPGLNYLCDGFKAFFTYVDRPMREMASLLHARRPAAEIMKSYVVKRKRHRSGKIH